MQIGAVETGKKEKKKRGIGCMEVIKYQLEGTQQICNNII